MKKLKEILNKVEVVNIKGSLNLHVLKVCFNSKDAVKDSVFIAIKGLNLDGNKFIDSAINKGSKVIITEDMPSNFKKQITYVQVKDARKSLSVISSNFYDNPSSKIKLIGVTGTNGKTTVVSLLFQLFQLMGYKCGMLSTIENSINNYSEPSTLTTLDSLSINHFLHKMVQDKCEYCFMEVSSHSLSQDRVFCLDFNVAMFLNISHDHLDYHKNFNNYLLAKKSFFDLVSPKNIAFINKDDDNFFDIVDKVKLNYYTFSFENDSDFNGKVIRRGLDYSLLNFSSINFKTSLLGDFNFYNLLSVFCVAKYFIKDIQKILKYFELLEAPKGRMQRVKAKKDIIALVDYAHTPDALEKVLITIRSFKKTTQSIITVFGCGGDRDKSKRSLMGKVADKFSDITLVTSDNPRTEKPSSIIEDIKLGFQNSNKTNLFFIDDRLLAIKKACQVAKNDDIILIAGKGHEKYQEINGVRHSFDDVKIIEKLLK